MRTQQHQHASRHKHTRICSSTNHTCISHPSRKRTRTKSVQIHSNDDKHTSAKTHRRRHGRKTRTWTHIARRHLLHERPMHRGKTAAASVPSRDRVSIKSHQHNPTADETRQTHTHGIHKHKKQIHSIRTHSQRNSHRRRSNIQMH